MSEGEVVREEDDQAGEDEGEGFDRDDGPVAREILEAAPACGWNG